MRHARANLGAAYLVAAGVFGGALLIGTRPMPSFAADGDAPARTWYERMEMRLDPPPDSVTIEIGSWSAPLRRLDEDKDEKAPAEQPVPFVPPVPEPPHAIPAELPKAPLITKFASAESLAPVIVLRDMPEAEPVANVAAPALTQFASLAPLRPVPVTPPVPPADGKDVVPGGMIRQVVDRLRTKMPRDLYRNFDLFLYVSKSSAGPLAQRMYVFAKDRQKGRRSELTLLHEWPVSTGREDYEVDNRGARTSTATPAGYYQLDPKRFYRTYTSSQWGRAMPNSMFFDWMVGGYRTGLAIHGVLDEDELEALGSRASAGCVHLSPDAAKMLFNMILRNYKGMVPRFAYDRAKKTIANDGTLAHDRNGELNMVEGYKALVVIENYGGETQFTGLDMDSPRPEG